MRTHHAVALLIVLAFSARLFAADAAKPTQAEIEQAYAQAQYPQALQMIAKVMILKGDAAQGYDHHKLLRLKGEIMLRQKGSSEAATAFEDAVAETKDAKAAAIDHATSILIKKSANQAYTPKPDKKTTPPTTRPAIDIIAPDSRKLAFKAAFDDAWTTDEPKISAALKGKALPPVLDAAPIAHDLHSLEIAASDSDAKSGKLTTDLATHAKTLLTDALTALEQKVEAAKTSASAMVEYKEPVAAAKGQKTQQYTTKYKERGLTSAEAATLRDAISTTTQIDPATTSLAKAFPEQKSEFAAAKTKADQVHKEAQAALSATYNKTSNTKQ